MISLMGGDGLPGMGAMSKSGELQFNFPKEFTIPEEEKKNMSSELWMNLFIKGECRGSLFPSTEFETGI